MKENYKEYNLLTKRLLEEGYSAEHHPDHVRVDVPMCQEKTLDNYDGGFTYERWWIFEQTFRTPCGLQCKGLQCHSNMSYMGIEWTFENDMATIHCPYEKKECKLKHEYLQENKVLRYECEVHMTKEEYYYEGSVEHILKLHDDEIRRQEVSFRQQKNGRVCREHMRFNRDTLEWEMNYDPYHCGSSRCAGMCPVLGHELDKKKGNVFYDVKISYLRNDLNGTLLEGQVDTRIKKTDYLVCGENAGQAGKGKGTGDKGPDAGTVFPDGRRVKDPLTGYGQKKVNHSMRGRGNRRSPLFGRRL